MKDIDKLPTTRSIDGESHQLIMVRMINLKTKNAEMMNTVSSVFSMITDKMSCLSGLFSDRISGIENQIQVSFTHMKDQFTWAMDLHGVSQLKLGVEDMQLSK